MGSVSDQKLSTFTWRGCVIGNDQPERLFLCNCTNIGTTWKQDGSPHFCQASARKQREANIFVANQRARSPTFSFYIGSQDKQK